MVLNVADSTVITLKGDILLRQAKQKFLLIIISDWRIML